MPDNTLPRAPGQAGGAKPPLFQAGEEIFGAAFDGRVLRRFLEFLKPYRRMMAAAVIGVLAFTLTQIALPLVIRHVIDDALTSGADAERLLTLAVGVFFGVVLVNWISNYYQQVWVAVMAERVLIDLRRAMYAHLQRVSLSFMDRTQVGQLMSRLQGDVNALQEFLESSIFAIGDFALLVGIVIVLLSLDPKLGLLTLSVVPILFIVRMIWLPAAKRAFLRARETSSIVNSALAENINGVRTVQEMTREGFNFATFREKAAEHYRTSLRATRLAQVMVPTVDTLTGAAMAIVIVVGGNLVLDKALDVGVMVAFLFYVQRFFDPIRSLTMQYSVMQQAMASGQRIFEVLNVPIDVQDRPGAQALQAIDGSVEFRNVTFGYVPDLPVLKNVSLRVAPGETVALVGPTGSGKTSTMALLHRFYEVWQGEILVGGSDVRDVTQESLGRHIAMVLQEPFLFTGSVFENIRYRSLHAGREAVVQAAKTVGAHDFIVRLPDGYDTVLGQRGVNLSIGQRQLLSFARAIVSEAGILVLDEATANVDSFTERDIQAALQRTLAGRTGIIIAHRLATVRHADRIIVLNHGEIVEQGTHAQLLARKGLYHRLHAMNVASFDDVPAELVAAS
ncbi:MAG: multidrug ABC transporter [Betaproteobacteria bacterium RIFCSPLOWO2_02_FULL_65_24]|nr:MAG: multidrug ABC transporter [Betaproteobacteria bacterium RIFCSPLOWO2_02_FULL_65_24]OGA96336.1 MAG: multidrug ABC transporter [Betaproteobacteria bacterium RIFCSPLOWO2_12_FULL_66_14]